MNMLQFSMSQSEKTQRQRYPLGGVRTRSCVVCQAEFSYPIARGTDSTHCSSACREASRVMHRSMKRALVAPCVCGKPGDRKGGLCEACYVRGLRHAKGMRPRSRRLEYRHSQGYVMKFAPDHPLTKQPQRYEYKHRLVFYDAHGEGPFLCHWCGCSVEWQTMHVDHKNSIRDDNDLDNLVPSCAHCNQERGREKNRQNGRRLRLGEVEMCVNEWARVLGIGRSSIIARLNRGWSIERTLTTPRGKFGPKLGARAKTQAEAARGARRRW